MDRGLISLKFEGFFAKWPGKARSGPSARPIRRPRKAGDVAASLLAEFWCLNCTYNVARVEVMDETGCGLIQLKSKGFFEKKLREDKDGGLILLKLKVLFANFLQPALLDCGLISRKAEGFFAKFLERGT